VPAVLKLENAAFSIVLELFCACPTRCAPAQEGGGIDEAVATLASEFVANLKLTSPLPRKFLCDAFDVAAKLRIFAF
jgi:hypothetical protein